MNKLKKWLLHNTSLKIISFILAFAIWLMVSNSANPEKTETLNVPVTILNENVVTGNNRVFSTDFSTVTVTYKIRTKDIASIKSDDFKAFADFNNMSAEGKVPVILSVAENALEYIDDAVISPSELHVISEKIQQKKFFVNHTIVGEPAEGYVEGDLDISPEYFYVKGPVSVVGQISSTGIIVDVTNADTDIEGTAEIIFYDANGNILSDIGTSLSYAGGISYSLPVYKTKSLSINAFTGGSPAQGYYVEGVETSPTFITVYGEDDALKSHSYILIPGSDLNINGASSNKTVTVEAEKYLPENISLEHPDTEIVIYIKIRRIPESENPSEPNGSAVSSGSSPAAYTAPGPVIEKKPDETAAAEEIKESAAPVHDETGNHVAEENSEEETVEETEDIEDTEETEETEEDTEEPEEETEEETESAEAVNAHFESESDVLKEGISASETDYALHNNINDDGDNR